MDAIRRQFASDLATERVRLLYQGSRFPTLLMLLCGLVSALSLWDRVRHDWLVAWLLGLVLLAVLRLSQVTAFHRAPSARQSARRWRYLFMSGAGASGLALAAGAILLVPSDVFMLQATVFGLIGAAAISASVAYAVSLPAFLCFSLPCLLPSTAYLLLSPHEVMRGWGLLTAILLLALLAVVWQVNRLVRGGLLQRFHNQALIQHLEQARVHDDELNRELAREVEQRRRAEQELAQRVVQRTLELDATGDALHRSEASLALVLEASELGLWDWNLATDEVQHTRLREIFGLAPESVRHMLRDLRPRLHPDDQPVLRRALIEHMKGISDGYCIEYRVRHADGHWVWVEDRGRQVERAADGRVLRMLGTRRDISQRKRREEEQRLAAMVFEAASEGIVILDADYRILMTNQAYTQVTGYRLRDVQGRLVGELAERREQRRQYRAIRIELERNGHWQGELMATRRNGESYPQWLKLDVVRDQQGRISHVVAFFSDLTARRAAEERLRYLTHYDELTGLANRMLFKERLFEACQRVRQDGRRLALLQVDLDRFKLLNDSLGHEVADQLLREVGQRLAQLVPEANTVARLSGDEFAILLDDCPAPAELTRLAERLLARLVRPQNIAGHELTVSASIGISLMPENAREAVTLISQAGMALQQAKHLGGNALQFFSDDLRACTVERLRLENELRKGIEQGQLVVFYQPKMNLGDDTIRSAEALVRWQRPELGLVGPGEFIGLAEETGLIVAIGEFVLREACRQACAWRRDGVAELRVSVNVSVQQVRQGNLLHLVRQVLDDTGLPPHLLELELTESQLLDNVESVISILGQLRALGVKLAIDDFGTGYSSLSYLKRFPVDYVKIDRTFVRDLSEGGEDAAITRAIIALVHSLELKVVAEGVETREQLEFLRAQGCDEIQGFLISPPVPPERFLALLRY